MNHIESRKDRDKRPTMGQTVYFYPRREDGSMDSGEVIGIVYPPNSDVELYVIKQETYIDPIYVVRDSWTVGFTPEGIFWEQNLREDIEKLEPSLKEGEEPQEKKEERTCGKCGEAAELTWYNEAYGTTEYFSFCKKHWNDLLLWMGEDDDEDDQDNEDKKEEKRPDRTIPEPESGGGIRG
jgi:hypothetical protein